MSKLATTSDISMETLEDVLKIPSDSLNFSDFSDTLHLPDILNGQNSLNNPQNWNQEEIGEIDQANLKTQNKENLILGKIKKIWQSLGPGLVTGASDDDPSGITTYSQAGATFGLNTLWTTFLSFPLMLSVQEMCGRIGIVQQKGLMSVVLANYPRFLGYALALITIPACVLNIAANLGGMGAVVYMVWPVMDARLWTGIFAILISFLMVILPYKKLENYLKWLCLVLLVYLIVPFLVQQNWLEIGHSIIFPQIQFNKDYLLMLVAILGTTISPYLFIWQTSMETEEISQKIKENGGEFVHLPSQFQNQTILQKEVKNMRKDNFVGMFFSNLVMFFVILTAGTILHKNGVNQINSVQDAAVALRPIAGENSYFLFAMGVVGTGFLAIPVLAGACAYIVSDLTGFFGSMDAKFLEAKSFYVTIIGSILVGFALTLFGMDPVQMLIWTAVIYGMVSPILIAFLLHICNNSTIMGKFTNSKLSNFFGGLCFVLMFLSSFALLFTFF